MRVLGLDLGNKTLGIAMSDSEGILVSPFENFEFANRNFLCAAKRVKEICSIYNIETIALGNPIMLSGEESIRSNITRKFASMILKLNPTLEIVLIDERFTSVEAKSILKECNYSETNKQRVRDSVAACLILESYLDRIKRKEEK